MATRTVVTAVAVHAAILLACSPSSAPEGSAAEKPLVVEEVALPVDADLTTAEDAKGPPMVESLGGVLPSDYPRDLPVPERATIVDFGGSRGERYIEFNSQGAPAAVAAELRKRLSTAGWQLSGDDRGWVAVGGQRRARFTLSDVGGGTRIRVDY